MTAERLLEASRWRLSPEIAYHEDQNRVRVAVLPLDVVSSQNPTPVTLSDTGYAIWEAFRSHQCEPTKDTENADVETIDRNNKGNSLNLDELVAQLAADFCTNPDLIRPDVVAFVLKLEGLKILERL